MRGFAAIGMIIAMALMAVLVLVYMRATMPTADDAGQQRTAIDGARERAAEVETQQRERMEEMQRSLGAP